MKMILITKGAKLSKKDGTLHLVNWKLELTARIDKLLNERPEVFSLLRLEEDPE